MINGLNNNLNLGNVAGSSGDGTSIGSTGAGKPGATSFSDMLKNSIDEVSRLQQDATQATNDVGLGKTENVEGVMSAVQKSDLAFKTLLAIRSKLMDAYEEIKNIPI